MVHRHLSVDYVLLFSEVVRCFLWIVGAAVALKFRSLYPNTSYITALGMGLMAITNVVQGIASSHVVNSEPLLVYASILSIPAVILLVEGLYLRIVSTKELLRRLTEIKRGYDSDEHDVPDTNK